MNDCRSNTMNAQIVKLFGLSMDQTMDTLFNDQETPQECSGRFLDKSVTASRSLSQMVRKGVNDKVMGFFDLNWAGQTSSFWSESKPYGM